ncbi:MAG: tRNA (adenosine(37)-N6)-threonylcarbamoyltransferase complex dimerization subunit type 1 TsaB [Flavobacteriales bacterium]|nr:tRNA (adenosine(37)-N6)-threonylcarbamoyltransferase complex dimerization subunit type 1 TsaB [Flavobacteriales bacterium]
MAYFLAIETATKVCSVAVFENNSLMAVKEENGDYSHAENLAVFADELLEKCSIKTSQLSAVFVSKGPGSYTGLQIGVSFAKGLCYALKIPLISIETLKSMAWGFINKNTSDLTKGYLVCPMIDARRMEVYTAIYQHDLVETKSVTADIIEEDSYLEFLARHQVFFIGDGANKCKDVIQHKHADFSSEVLPSAVYLGQLGYEKFEKKQFEDVAYFEPFYLKEFVALKGKKLV